MSAALESCFHSNSETQTHRRGAEAQRAEAAKESQKLKGKTQKAKVPGVQTIQARQVWKPSPSAHSR
jgi:hypothetical protein